MSNKKKRGQKNVHQVLVKRPDKLHNFLESVSLLKKSVYMIARGRFLAKDSKLINWTTVGTGFLAAQNRFVTAGHVINDPDPQKNDNYRHQDGDKYYLLKHDDENNVHFAIFELQSNKNLFIYPDLDLAVIHLEDGFYQNADKIFANKDDFIRISREFSPIGTEIGILGYPLCNLLFQNQDLNSPLIGDVLLRTDRGVINSRYQISATNYVYEFTMAFNPGNSGGPIFDVKTGKVLSVVRGFKTIRLNEREISIPEEGVKALKQYKEKSFIETLNTTYSFGFATPTFLEIFKKHNI